MVGYYEIVESVPYAYLIFFFLKKKTTDTSFFNLLFSAIVKSSEQF